MEMQLRERLAVDSLIFIVYVYEKRISSTYCGELYS